MGIAKNLLVTNVNILGFIVQAFANSITNRNDPLKKRQRALELTAEKAKVIMKAFNIEVKVNYSSPDLFHKNYFMVCNHMSYVDILVLSSIQPAVFVTSVEMEKTFFLGDLAKLGGSFFVDRINRRKMKNEVESLVKLLADRFNVFIFPEGTSTNGLEILPFKKSLFRVPHQTGYPILPICLKYKTIDGEPFNEKNCDRISWHGDMGFAQHFIALHKVKEIVVEVDYLTPIDSTQFSDHAELAEKAYQQIKQRYLGLS